MQRLGPRPHPDFNFQLGIPMTPRPLSLPRLQNGVQRLGPRPHPDFTFQLGIPMTPRPLTSLPRLQNGVQRLGPRPHPDFHFQLGIPMTPRPLSLPRSCQSHRRRLGPRWLCKHCLMEPNDTQGRSHPGCATSCWASLSRFHAGRTVRV